MDNVLGVGILLCNRLAEYLVFFFIILAIANVPNTFAPIGEYQRLFLVQVVDYLAVFVYLQLRDFFVLVADEAVDHRFENIVERICNQVFLRLYVLVGVPGAPTEKRLHYVVEFQQAVFEILVLDTAKFAQPAFAFQKACDFRPFERNVELALRHFEPELVLDELHRGEIQNKQTVVQIKNLLLVHQFHVDWRITLNKGRLFRDGPLPVNPIVSAMLVLGDKDEQVLVFLVEQFHAAHDIEQSRIAGILLELGMFHVVRGTDASHIAVGAVLVDSGIEPSRKRREKPALNVLYGRLALSEDILAVRSNRHTESLCIVAVEKDLGQHEYRIPVEKAITDAIYFGTRVGRFGIKTALALEIAIAPITDNLLEVIGTVDKFFEQENHEQPKSFKRSLSQLSGFP